MCFARPLSWPNQLVNVVLKYAFENLSCFRLKAFLVPWSEGLSIRRFG